MRGPISWKINVSCPDDGWPDRIPKTIALPSLYISDSVEMVNIEELWFYDKLLFALKLNVLTDTIFDIMKI